MKAIPALQWLAMSPEAQQQYKPRKLTIKDIRTIRSSGNTSVAIAVAQIDAGRQMARSEERSMKSKLRYAESVLSQQEQKALKNADPQTIFREAQKKAREQSMGRARQKILKDTPYVDEYGEFTDKEPRYESQLHTKMGDPAREYLYMLNQVDAPDNVYSAVAKLSDYLETEELEEFLTEAPNISDIYKAHKRDDAGALGEMYNNIMLLVDRYETYIGDDEDYDDE